MSCTCHNQECNITEENKKEESIQQGLYIISLLIFAFSFFTCIPSYIKIVMYMATILFAGYEIILEGIKNIFKLNFEEDTLMTIAVVAACILGEFREGCLVILLFKLGEMIEEKAVYKSNQNIENIVDIKATNANLLKNNEIEVIDVKEIKVGDYILIKPGESIPVDCKVILGSANIDTSNITGESKPIYIEANTDLPSGTINLDGSLKCIVTKEFKDSTASQIVDLVYEAQNNKGKTEAFITKFSKGYTPVVIIIAIIIAIIPILLGLETKEWIMRALVFLVASCPCSIVISVPLALYTCLGSISKKGMLMKGTKHIEDLAKANIIAFDKTGTLTTGKMEIDTIEVYRNYEEKELLEYMYSLEANSSHPIASSIMKRIEQLGISNNIKKREVTDYRELVGYGICGNIDGQLVTFGNKKLLDNYHIPYQKIEEDRNYIAIDNQIIGSISLKEEIRSGLTTFIGNLKKIGIRKIIMLTGDSKKNAEKIAKEIQIEEVYSNLLPKDKLEKVQSLKKEGKTIFVGDGINDSPVLATADFSISMGEGTEIASNTADSILISNNLNAITKIIQTARKTMYILKSNIIFSLMIKVMVLITGIVGFAPIWLAVFADVGVTVLTVLNSIRIK